MRSKAGNGLQQRTVRDSGASTRLLHIYRAAIARLSLRRTGALWGSPLAEPSLCTRERPGTQSAAKIPRPHMASSQEEVCLERCPGIMQTPRGECCNTGSPYPRPLGRPTSWRDLETRRAGRNRVTVNQGEHCSLPPSSTLYRCLFRATLS